MIQCFKWASEYYETTEENKYEINGINHAERIINSIGKKTHTLAKFKENTPSCHEIRK